MESVVTMYKESERIDQLQNLQFYAAIIVDGYRYFSAINYNGLFKQNLQSAEVEFIGLFPKEDFDAIRLHRKVFQIEGQLYFIPYNGRNIEIYNIATNQFYFVAIKDSMKFSFSNAYVCRDMIILVPCNGRMPFVIFRWKEGTCEVVNSVLDTIKHTIQKESISIDVYASILIGDELVMSIYGENMLYKINTYTWEIDIHELPQKYHLKNISVINDSYWFTLVDSYNVLQYNTHTGCIKEYQNEYAGTKIGPYMKCVSFDEKIFLLPCAEDHIAVINESEQKIVVVKELLNESFQRRNTESAIALEFETDKNGITVYPNAGTGMLIINKKIELEMIEVCFKKGFDKFYKKFISNMLKEKFQQRKLWIELEEDEFTLENYINCVCNINKAKNVSDPSHIGGDIWNYLK